MNYEEKDIVERAAGHLGFNKIYDRSGYQSVIEAIKSSIRPTLDLAASSKQFSFCKSYKRLSRAEDVLDYINEFGDSITLYSYHLPNDFMGYISDNGRSRDMSDNLYYSDLADGLYLQYTRRIEVTDISYGAFEYFAVEVALATASRIGEDARIPVLSSLSREYLNAALKGGRFEKKIDVFGRGTYLRDRRRIRRY